MKKILFATDGSEAAQRASETVAAILQAWPEAQAIVVYVSTEMPYPYLIAPEDYELREQEYAQEMASEVVRSLAPTDPSRIRFLHLSGRPGAQICQAAVAEQADLVVVGSHGKGMIDRMLVGSVSHEVVQRSKVPVLVVKE